MPKRDGIADFFRSIFTDVRQKVLEEMWFGRAVTSEFSNGLGDQSPARQTVTEMTVLHRTTVSEIHKGSLSVPRPSFAEEIAERTRGLGSADHEQDHGIDR